VGQASLAVDGGRLAVVVVVSDGGSGKNLRRWVGEDVVDQLEG